MVGKNNQYVKKIKQGTKVETYSIKKFKVGIASVAIGCSVFFGAGAVAMAGEQTGAPVPPGESNTTVVPQGGERAITGNQSATGTQSNPTPAKEGKIEPEKPKDTVNKAKLETLIKEVEGLNLEKYTEESVKGLKTELAKAKEVFETAQNKEEVEAAWRTLFTYKNSKLVVKRTPKLPQDNTPKPENGKETVGINAENTEPNGTNIAGHNHSMNGTTRSEGSEFREASTELQDVEIGRWNATRKKFDEGNVYGVYPGDNLRNNSLKIKVKSPNANITKLTVTKKEGGNFPGEHTTGIGGKEADLYFEGNLPNNGSWLMEVTAETTKGIKKFEFGVYTHFQAPKITTENSVLVGKANEKPDIDVEIPSVPKLPEGSRMMLYVVGRGAEDYGGGFEPDPAYSLVKAKKQIASGKEGTGGKKTVTITENDYTVEKLGTEPFKVLTVIELIGSDGNYKEDHRPGLRGSFYSSIRSATEAPTVDKSGAINAITTEAEKQNSLIDSKQNVFTSTEVSAFKKMVTDAANEAKNNINKTDTDTDTKVTAERDKGILALDKIGAIVEIEAAKKAKDTAIENNANITDKAAAKAATKAAADAAKAEINKDTTNTADKVTTEKEKGLLGLEKAGAIAEIDAAKAAKDAAIENNANITDKAAAKAATKAAADAAKAEINKDTTNTAALVTTEKEKGLLGLEKAGAIAEIDAAKAAKNKTVDTNNNLTTEEKAEVKKQTQKEATDAIANTNEATTSTTVTTAKDNGIKAINAVALPTKTVKSEAISEINKALAAKNKTVDTNNNLTTEEKAEVKKQTQKEATDAIANINKATTSADVTTAKDNGIKAINAVAIPTKTVKSNAIEEVKKALDTKVKSIESSKEFTDNDKGILKDKAEKVAMTAIVKIKTATTNAVVETAKTEGIERINSVEARLAVKLEIPELIITKWQDEAGNDLRPADAKAPSELGEANEALAHGEIPGYEYVVTKTDKENVVVTHIFRKLPKKDRTFPEKPKTSNPNKADESQSPVKENVSMKSNLPNTGVTGTNSGLAGLGLAVFGGLLTVARQRRRNK